MVIVLTTGDGLWANPRDKRADRLGAIGSLRSVTEACVLLVHPTIVLDWQDVCLKHDWFIHVTVSEFGRITCIQSWFRSSSNMLNTILFNKRFKDVRWDCKNLKWFSTMTYLRDSQHYTEHSYTLKWSISTTELWISDSTRDTTRLHFFDAPRNQIKRRRIALPPYKQPASTLRRRYFKALQGCKGRLTLNGRTTSIWLDPKTYRLYQISFISDAPWLPYLFGDAPLEGLPPRISQLLTIKNRYQPVKVFSWWRPNIPSAMLLPLLKWRGRAAVDSWDRRQ